MRNVLVFAVFSLVVAGIVPRIYVNGNAPIAARATTATAPAQPDPVNYGRTVTIQADSRGHFRIDGDIDGRRMDFMVDTGASVIALRESDASRLGIHPSDRDYSARVKTANGSVRGAPVRLERVEIGGLTVRQVNALVLPDDALSENLLGLSYLSRLRRFEYSNGRMVLEQ
jgi:aspartyl protease family protein